MYIKKRNLCIGCMKPLGGSTICEHCGLKQEEYNPIPRCLMPGTVLSERYVTGKVLGEGSFGITYMGWDQSMDVPVAIKEYFPSDMVSRDVVCGSDNRVYLYESEKKKDYDSYLKKFYEEAKTLSRVNQIEGIVSVRDFFYENNTAYIVMQHIGGMSVKQYVKENGKIPGETVVEMFRPVLLALEKVHGMGIVHRDISPDNIIVKEDGSLVLIDFGAARLRNIDNTKTMTVMFKRGFSPEEQYRYKGRWGAYTDVYSLCATMYFMLTGEVPMDSVMRAIEDDIPSLISMQDIDLPMYQKQAIMKGMSVSAEIRFQSVVELWEALFSGTCDKNTEKRVFIWRKKQRAAVTAAIAIAAVVMIALFQLFGNGGHIDKTEEVSANSNKMNETKISGAAVLAEPNIQPPEEKTVKMDLLVGQTRQKAEKTVEKYGELVTVTWKKKYSDSVKKGRVLSQSIPEGSDLGREGANEEPRELLIVVSRGKKKREVPDLLGKSQETAIQMLEKRKLKHEVMWKDSSQTTGSVIAQSVTAGKKVATGTRIQITLSNGVRSAQSNVSPKSSSNKGSSSKSKNNKEDNDFAGVIQ